MQQASSFQRDRTAERALFNALVRAADAGVNEIIVGAAALDFLYKYFNGHKFPVAGCGSTRISTRVRRGLLFWALVQIARRMLRPPMFPVLK